MFNLSFVSTAGAPVDLRLAIAETLFVVGANGTGKSSLMYRFYVNNIGRVRQISAHRQTWFSTSSVTLSAQQKRDTENAIANTDMQAQSRWMDHHAANRSSIAIYDLVDAENVRARSIAGAVDAGDLGLATMLSKADAPISQINELLRQSNMPIAVSVRENEQVLASKNEGALYSVAELSDGERNALLIAANVLTAKPGSLILIDEPERHLHRSIISPLLTLLFAKRSDCSFVVATHDIQLPLDNPSARVALIRACNYNGNQVVGWDADIVSPMEGIDDAIKYDLLGSRRKLIYVEGTDGSLDKALYAIIFPGVSILPKESCHEVERAVLGVRSAGQFHWLSAWGIVDNDRRTVADIEHLRQIGVYALPVFSVESIYYDPAMQRAVATKHAQLVGGDVEEQLRGATAAAIAAIVPHTRRMGERAVEKTLRDRMFRLLPRRGEIAAALPIEVQIDVRAIVDEEQARIEGWLAQRDLQTVIRMYPVRETPALASLVHRLGFITRHQYEAAVRKVLMEDAELLGRVRGLFGPLVNDLM